ncbi:S8 family serine peptidase [Dokdonella immobilis]|uniref:Serine protease, subtilisin family n=1 Tax=Dokdonella immobilis TaxID=578942 RepID=A0A1I5AZY8_9GAMM|nr:S8 family serine peptidase [Dokdonella immobilis]SFN68017.1 Serine protease, subtilisin family [Dokdonella immobilis]
MRLLIKSAPIAANRSLALGGARFKVVPLMPSVDAEGGTKKGVAAQSRWHLLSAESDIESNPWEVCHRMLSGGFGVDGLPTPEFAEPDLEQQWLDNEALGQLPENGACEEDIGQDKSYPTNGNPLWHVDDDHSQLRAARSLSGKWSNGHRTRIAHLDTGFFPGHQTLPKNLRLDLARNFVEDDKPNDASDQSSGFFNNLGHGTGTLSILAGQPLGTLDWSAAPLAEVIPIRVANRVVLFKNSSIARALNYVHELCQKKETFVDVVTMSMGGLASRAWADAINALYDLGVFVVTASGNNFANIPTRFVVFPARFRRVVAACGVMADQAPYADLGFGRMAGNYGPKRKMTTALAAYTPNVPWARFGCPSKARLSGAGTSSATPQVAGAAAHWIQKNRDALATYPKPWMRVEAVRRALFDSANPRDADHLGRGTLRAVELMKQAPVDAGKLVAEKPDSARFAFLRLITGMGLAPSNNAQEMLELEALQLAASIEGMDELLDTDTPSAAVVQEVAQKLATHPRCSPTLRRILRQGEPSAPPRIPTSSVVFAAQLAHARSPGLPTPTCRQLRVYAFDPMLEQSVSTLDINEAQVDVRWEADLAAGPIGEYVEVIDADPSSEAFYTPVDLNHPHILARNGISPSTANPQFHQQMVYAVSMRTIEAFEKALGRVALWAPHQESEKAKYEDGFVRRLRLYPHAIRERNAYYSPERKAILFGYFQASLISAPKVAPGTLVFTCLSHDIIAHETSHALLDGLHRRFREPTNPDVLAFHEAFADIVALFQHFAIPEALESSLSEIRGDLRQSSLLSDLARQFGESSGHYGALRSAIRTRSERKADSRVRAYPSAPTDDPHLRGALLVAAFFEAFVQIYEIRTRELIQLATAGTEVLPTGRLPVVLVKRLAGEASKVAQQVLTIAIRALDYCPPTDITFGDYLRALITADRDLVPDDKRTYRVAFISAFASLGIYPRGVRALSVDSVAWEPPPIQVANLGRLFDGLRLSWDLKADRAQAFADSKHNAALVWRGLMDTTVVSDDEIQMLGLQRIDKPVPKTIDGRAGMLRKIEVHSVRPAHRIGPDGQRRDDLIVEITQTWRPDDDSAARYRGGCTLIVDLGQREIRYLVRKRVANEERVRQQLAFRASSQDEAVLSPYGDIDYSTREPFALLHRR